jgi:signal transduction histidine kinase
MFFAVWQSFFLFQLFYVFPRDRFTFPKWFKYGLFPSVFFTSILTLTPALFTGVVEYSIDGRIQKVANGPGIVVFGIVAVGLIIGSMYLLIKNLRSVKGIRRMQLQFILFGTAVTFCLYIIFNFILPAFFNNPNFIAYGAVFTLPFVGSTTYTIIKHRFLDIRLVVARSITYSLLIFLVIGFITFTLSIFGYVFTGASMSSEIFLISIGLALIVAFSFHTIEVIVEKVTERVLYKHHYDSKELLSSLSRIMASNLNLSLLVEMVLNEMMMQMKISFSFLILTNNHSIIWLKGAGSVIPKPDFNESQITNLIEFTIKKPGENMLVFDELVEGKEKDILRTHNIKILLPLAVKDEIIGAILLGEKESGEIYLSEDLDVLKILAPEIAVAVRNALSYEEIKRFNITLEQEIKQATESLQRANERLQQLDKMKDEFVSLASHELRTPMTVIKSYIWLMLQEKAGQLNEKQKTYLERTYSSTNRLINLVNDMLNVSRIESGRFVVDIKPIDLKDLINDVITEMLPKAEEEGISLFFENPPEEEILVDADADKIKEVLINLIGNSIKFTPMGGKIWMQIEKQDGEIKVKTCDTGKGISKEDMPKLFQKFGVVGDNYLTKQGTQGTGLGLYLSKCIVMLHGGTLYAESEGEGKGSVFTFILKTGTNSSIEETKPEGEGKREDAASPISA